MPERIQLSRQKGWRKPENTVVVARPSMWGNPSYRTSTLERLSGRFEGILARLQASFAKGE